MKNPSHQHTSGYNFIVDTNLYRDSMSVLRTDAILRGYLVDGQWVSESELDRLTTPEEWNAA